MSGIPKPVQRRALGERDTNVKSKLPTMSRLPTGAKPAPPVSRKRKSECMGTAPIKKVRMEPRTTARPVLKPVKSTIAKPALKPANQGGTRRTGTVAKRAATGPVARSKPAPGGGRLPSAPTKPAGVKKPAGAKSTKPGWDLRGQIADLKVLLQEKQEELGALRDTTEVQEQRIETFQSRVRSTEAKAEATRERLEAEVEAIRDLLEQKKTECAGYLRQTVKLEGELSRSKVRTGQLEDKVATQAATIGQQEATIAHQTDTIGSLTASREQLNAEVSTQKISIETKTSIIADRDREIADLQKRVEEMKAQIMERDHKLIEAEERRKVLHNQVQELKGNIRVFCRVRPLLEKEQSADAAEFISIDDDEKNMELTNLKDRSLNKTSKKLDFSFDHIFGPGSSQADVFSEISQLVQSALDGYNVCIFAYGQTGSGKTFTMEGPPSSDEGSEGMIPRSVSQVFLAALALQDKGWEFEMEATFLEIYNDTVHDLLGNGNTKKPEIRMVGRSKEVEVTNIVKYPVTSEGQVADLLAKAAKNRAVASTAYNERSSRSHSIFRLKITGSNKVTGDSSQGTLNLVDLAGSERLPEAGYEKERLKEMKKINQSLSNLGQVIKALAAKENHVPFRNCKLTHLLQDSLGGNSKTLMFVNVSPKEDCFQETLCSLRFAVMVNNCNIGTAQKRVK